MVAGATTTSSSSLSTSAYIHDRYLDAEERYEIFVVKAAERPHLLHWKKNDDDDDDDEYFRRWNEEKKVEDIADSSRRNSMSSPISHDDEKFKDSPPPPLTDGCDIPGWRSQRIAPGMNPHPPISRIATNTNTNTTNSLSSQLLPCSTSQSNRIDEWFIHQEGKFITKNYDGGICDDHNKCIDIEYPFNGILNIGAGTTLTRLESQFPFISSTLFHGVTNINNYEDWHHHQQQQHSYPGCCWWHSAKQMYRSGGQTMGRRGVTTAPTIDYEDAKRLVDYCAVNDDDDDNNYNHKESSSAAAAASSISTTKSHSHDIGTNNDIRPIVMHRHNQTYQYELHKQLPLPLKRKQTIRITYFIKEYEMKNRPVKILGATKGWLAMPEYNNTSKSNDIVTKEDNAQQSNYEQEDNIMAHDKNDFPHNEPPSSLWKDVGYESAQFHGGGRGGWTFANLLSRFGNTSFRFSDTHGEMMTLATYAKYITNPEGMLDDSPLGIYDSEFGDVHDENINVTEKGEGEHCSLSSSSSSSDHHISELRKEYTVPECFSRDLFELADDDDDDDTGCDCTNNTSPSTTSGGTSCHQRRPPYRWILIGPERSGTGMHVDPLFTNAWVTVLQGQKLWMLFPPDTPHDWIGMKNGSPQLPSSIWFRDYYEKITSPKSSWPKQYQPVEILHNPGETVFVPAGWPHVVLNLELTVAITHNYASEYGPHFERMCEEVIREEPDFAMRWLLKLIPKSNK